MQVKSSFKIHAMKTKIYFFLSIGYLLFTNVVNAQWQQFSGTSGKTVYCVTTNAGKIYAGASGAQSLYSSNNGSSWTSSSSGLTATEGIYSIRISGSTIFGGGQNGRIFTSINNGTSWSLSNTGMPNLLTDVQAIVVNGSNIFASTTNEGVYTSSNNGGSWTAVNNGFANKNIYSLALMGSNLFAGGEGGKLYSSSDNGANWTLKNNGLFYTIYVITVNGTKLYAGSESGSVFVSSDNGSTWTQLTEISTQQNKIRGIQVSGSNIFVGIQGEGVFLSTNNGTSWKNINNGLSNLIVRDLEINGTDLIACTNDGIFKRALTDLSSGLDENTTNPNTFSIYPNPVNNEFTIETSQPTNIKYHFEIMDLLGNSIAKGLIESNETIKMSDLAKGVYIVHISDENSILSSKKIIKQ